MRRLAVVIALTVCAGGLARTARADDTPPAEGETPLQLRPAPKPLELAPSKGGIGGGWKIVLLVGAGAAGLVWYKRKRAAGVAPAEPNGELQVLRKASLGGRGELVVVQVDGQRLLLGVTAQSITSLATLAYDEVDARERASAPPTARVDVAADADTLGDRFATMLGGAARQIAQPAAARVALPARADAEPIVAGQARGLVALARGRKR